MTTMMIMAFRKKNICHASVSLFDPPPRAILLFQSRGSRSASPALLYLLKGRLKNPSLFDEGEICQIFSSFFKKSRRWCQGFFSHDPLLLRQSTLVSSFSLRRAPAIKKSSARPFFAPFFLPSIGSRYGTFFCPFPLDDNWHRCGGGRKWILFHCLLFCQRQRKWE